MKTKLKIQLLLSGAILLTGLAGAAYASRSGSGIIEIVTPDSSNFKTYGFDTSGYQPCGSTSAGSPQFSVNTTQEVDVWVFPNSNEPEFVNCNGSGQLSAGTYNVRYSYVDGYDCAGGTTLGTMLVDASGFGHWTSSASFTTTPDVFLCVEKSGEILYMDIPVV